MGKDKLFLVNFKHYLQNTEEVYVVAKSFTEAETKMKRYFNDNYNPDDDCKILGIYLVEKNVVI